MDIICPHCKTTLEGDDSLVGEIVNCPKCLKTFRIPANFSTIGVHNEIGASPYSDSFKRDSSRSTLKTRFWIAMSVIALLAAATGSIALLVRTAPTKNRQTNQSNGTSNQAFDKSDGRYPKKGLSKKRVYRHSEEADRIYEEALKALISEEGKTKDVVKAYQGFLQAIDRGCLLAECALAHLCWTLSNADRMKLERAGISVMNPSEYVEHWKHAARNGVSHLAEFELGFYKLRTNQTDGWAYIRSAAEAGCSPAVAILRNYEKAQNSGSLGGRIFMDSIRGNTELLSIVYELCEKELKMEHNRYFVESRREELEKINKLLPPSDRIR